MYKVHNVRETLFFLPLILPLVLVVPLQDLGPLFTHRGLDVPRGERLLLLLIHWLVLSQAGDKLVALLYF